MNELNTDEFLKVCRDLHKAKYPSLETDEYQVLAITLKVAIEFRRTLEEIQEYLDRETARKKEELAELVGV